MKYIIITNNPLVKEKYVDKEVEFYDKKYQEILQIVKNKIALGHKMLTHPLSGSVKPKETPYKSIMISKDKEYISFKWKLGKVLHCVFAVKHLWEQL